MRAFFLFFFLGWSSVSFAQQASAFRFDHFTQEDGLSNNQVHCIFQDSEGWMWFGTTYGLNRFDGRTFKVFKHDPADTASLGANLVRTIFEDRHHGLWVGLENGGLCRYDRDREKFYRIRIAREAGRSVNGIAEDTLGNLWLATSHGLVRMWQGKEGTYLSEYLPLALLSEHIKKILWDKHGFLWLGTQQGLYLYDPVRRKTTHLELPQTTRGNDEIWALYADRTDRIWIGTYNSGLYYCNPWEVKLIKSAFDPQMERARTIRSVVGERDGRFWIGTRAGLFTFDGDDYMYHGLGGENDDLTSLNSVLSLCVDAKGDLWVGSRQGISYYVYEKQFIQQYSKGNEPGEGLNNSEIYAFLCEGDRIWIGTELGGINLLNRKTGRFSYFTKSNAGLTANCIKAFLQEGNKLWVGTFMGGISVMDIRTGRVVRSFKHDVSVPHSLADDRIWALFKDRSGQIWIGTSRGIDQYDPGKQHFIHRTDILRAGQVNWINEDQEGEMWFGCEDELVIYNPRQHKVRRYFYKTRAMVEMAKGEYYVSTTNGLGCFDKERGFYHFYTEKDGLVNSYTHSLLPGIDSTLWIATANGLSVFDLTAKTFKNFRKKDGLQDNQFNYGAYAKTDQGELLFGGINGFNIIQPAKVVNNPYVPPVVITDFKVFNEPHPLFRQKNSQTPIRLKYNQNMLSFSFAALNYVMAEKNRYRYRLEGLEEEWIDAGVAPVATYANLAPGDYTFRVIGANNDGVWNEKGAALYVTIIPPFWQQWWFRVLMGLVLAGVVMLIVRAYIFREQIKNRLLLEKNKARQLHEVDMMKLQFFTNVSHEIRTPLTLIIGPVEKLYRQAADEDIRVQLEMVYQNARKLLKLINQLLDFRKLEAGKYTVTYQNGDLVRFVAGITEAFREIAGEKGIQLGFHSNCPGYIAGMDADKLDKILNNLISNALKFTPKGGSIEVELQIGETAYDLKVSDTGIGIPAGNLEQVFNRFFQSPRSSEITGTGIGLSITRSFVELMGGTIDVRSEEGKGTAFLIHLPLPAEAEEKLPVVSEEGEETVQKAEEGNYLLVVDDNEDIRTFIKTHFKSSFRILEAADGKEGLEIAVRQVPDIILADMLMPVMNGLEMCRKLKKDDRTSHIPMIMLTAVNSKETELRSLLSGIDDYITKPFDIQILTAKVNNLLAIRNAMREKIKSDLLLRPADVVIDSPNERFLKKAVEVVEKYMDDADLDIEKFSEEMGVSRMQLYRKFEALTNMTVKEFIRNIRLKRAAQLLEQEKITISEVAWAVGFRDLSYFRKCFKEEYGVTPTDYIGQKRQ